MQRLLLWFFLACGPLGGLIGQPTPSKIAFQKGDFGAVLAQAQRSQKLVFIDVYTTWCAPCKLLDQQVFTDPAIAEQFNATFINYKLDAENDQGPEVALRYGVNAYPTLLFVNGDGELVHRLVGYRDAAELAKEAQEAQKLAQQNASLSWYQANYATKRRDTAFLGAYLNKLNLSNRPNAAVLDELVSLKMAHLPEADGAVLELLRTSLQAIQGPAFELAVQHAQMVDFKKIKLTAAASRALRQAYHYQLQSAIAGQNRAVLDTLLATIHRIEKPAMAKRMEEDYALRFAVAVKDLATIRRIVLPRMGEKMALDDAELKRLDSIQYKLLTYTVNKSMQRDTNSPAYQERLREAKNFATLEASHALNGGAWIYATTMTDSAELEQALSWAQRAVALQPEPQNFDTQARLLYRLQRRKEAFLAQQQAIDRANPAEKTKYQDTLQKMLTGKL